MWSKRMQLKIYGLCTSQNSKKQLFTRELALQLLQIREDTELLPSMFREEAKLKN